MNVNGTGIRQITSLGGANWAPFFLPDGHRIIFSSDHNSSQGFNAFDLYVFDESTGQLEQITKDGAQFDSFPMFSYNGKQLVWASSRNGSEYEMNLFIADWVDIGSTPSSASPIGSTPSSAPPIGSALSSPSPTGSTLSSASASFRHSAVLIFCLFFLSRFY